MKSEDDKTQPKEPSHVVPFNPKALPNDPQKIRIAELEEKLSEARSQLGLALNSVHQMRRWLLQIRNITTHVNFDEV